MVETATRSGSETRRRANVVPLRMTDDELTELDWLAAKAGKSRQEILRTGLLLQVAEAVHRD